MRITLPGWADMHVHFRQDKMLGPLIKAHLSTGCGVVVAMPNTVPPVLRVFETDPGAGWSIQGYRVALLAAGADRFADVIVPLYLSAQITPEAIAAGAEAGLLRAAKYYPPYGTTNSAAAIGMETLLDERRDILQALSDNGVILCIHGEDHGMKPKDWFGPENNAESSFYYGAMPILVKRFPDLRIVCEHVSTVEAVEFVLTHGGNVVATVTPQHMLYTVADLLQGWFAHLKCMPILKFEKDRLAILEAVMMHGQTKFFAGTDSAPHPSYAKLTDCGCASGCYTGPVAPQLYAQAFVQNGVDLDSRQWAEAFRSFMTFNGPNFYRSKRPTKNIVITDEPSDIMVIDSGDGTLIPLPLGMQPRPLRQVTIPFSCEVVK